MPAILWADAVETGEALAETKTHLLQQAGLQVAEPPRCARTVAAALAAARVLCLNLEEASSLLPAAWDGRSSLSGRNDAAALSLLLQRARESGDAATLDALRAHAPTAHAAAAGAADAGRSLPSDSAEAACVRWAEEQGVQSAAQPAVFAGGLRGLAAVRPQALDDVVVAAPAAALVTLRTAMESELAPLLTSLPGLDDDLRLVLWTLWDAAAGAASPRAALWSAMPPPIAPWTGAAGLPLAPLLGECSQLAAEAAAAADALARQHAMLFPALLHAAPGLFQPADAFSRERFLWAAQLWMSYAMRVVLPGDDAPSSALVPVALFANHSLHAHVVRFSRVDADGVLRLRTVRAAATGEQLTVSYGPLGNGPLIYWYGFACAGNPYDSIPLALEADGDEEEEEGEEEEGAITRTTDLRRRLLQWAGVGDGSDAALREGPHALPLLTTLRLLTAPRDALLQAAAAAAGDDAEPPPPPGCARAAARAATVRVACGSSGGAAALEAVIEALTDALAASRRAAAHAPADGAVAALAGTVTAYLDGQERCLERARRLLAELRAEVAEEEEGS